MRPAAACFNKEAGQKEHILLKSIYIHHPEMAKPQKEDEVAGAKDRGGGIFGVSVLSVVIKCSRIIHAGGCTDSLAHERHALRAFSGRWGMPVELSFFKTLCARVYMFI